MTECAVREELGELLSPNAPDSMNRIGVLVGMR